MDQRLLDKHDQCAELMGPRNTILRVSLRSPPGNNVMELPQGETTCTDIPNSPHPSGISRVDFVPLTDNNTVLVTAGKQHRIATWRCVDGVWESYHHYKLHSSSVTGSCGLPGRSVILTCGRDKNVFVYDYQHADENFKLNLDVPCLGIASNPSDSNLICVQTSGQWLVLSRHSLSGQQESQKDAPLMMFQIRTITYYTNIFISHTLLTDIYNKFFLKLFRILATLCYTTNTSFTTQNFCTNHTRTIINSLLGVGE